MAHNHLEQLIVEWYEFQGYFVRRNVNVGPRPKGGFECELDVVAFHPGNLEINIKPHLVHLEPSLDADSWDEREERFAVKFAAGKKYIKGLFKGLILPDEIEQIAVLVFANRTNRPTIGGGILTTADQWIEKIMFELKDKRLNSRAIPEQWPILRTLQYVNQYRNVVMKVWNSPAK